MPFVKTWDSFYRKPGNKDLKSAKSSKKPGWETLLHICLQVSLYLSGAYHKTAASITITTKTAIASPPPMQDFAGCHAGSDDYSLDYTLQDDGTCICKLCGEQVASRTHWYRHKYKVHNVALFRCEKCEIFFKSKKGYEGHLANKHSPKLIKEEPVDPAKQKTKKEVEGLNKVSLPWNEREVRAKVYLFDFAQAFFSENPKSPALL